MRFHQLDEIIKGVAKKRKIVGMDFVELNPIPGMVAPDYLAAKLIYRAIDHAMNGR